MTKVTCYDGVGVIGGNKILLEDGDTKLWLDFGLDFGRMGMFYEEYLKPKSCAGLYEPVRMGLLPPIRDLYRSDLLCSIADPWDGIESHEIGEVAGILLSHAHLDHFGSLHFVRENVPIYCSAMTAAIAKSAEDTGAGAGDHYCYTELCEASETGEIRSAHFAKNPSVARPFVFTEEEPSPAFAEFWSSTPSSRLPKGRQHEAGAIPTSGTCGGLKLRRFPVDHSVYGACAWAIETSEGTIVYTGDLRCHGRQGDLTWKFAEEAAKLKPRVLIIEGTRIESESTSTEDEIRDRALAEVRNAKGLVVADFGPRNIERLISFLEIARETGRKLVLLPKDAYLLDAMRLVDASIPSLEEKSILIYAEYEGSSTNWKKALRERYPSKFASPQQVSRSQDKAICCFSFFDVNELAYIRPAPGSIWIYSSCEAFNEEMRIDFDRLRNWLGQYGVVPLGVPSREKPDEKSPFHVSGHASKGDLLKLIEIIRPRTVIPVHTEKPDLYAQAVGDLSEVILPKRGEPIPL